MAIIETIKRDRIQAMKDKDAAKRGMLDMILNTANSLAKEAGTGSPTDEHTITAIRREAKAAHKNAEDDRLPADKRTEAEAEAEFFESYLPRQMGEQELRELIAGLPAPDDIRAVMAELDSRIPGQYDKGLAARIAKGR